MTSAQTRLATTGRKLDDELVSLVARFGADAVRAAAKRATRKKKGRRPENDVPLLRPWLEKDVEDWFNGIDPFKARSNYSIAQEFAEQFPGHSRFATKDRIERKLRRLRQLSMLARVQRIAKEQHPYAVFLRALRCLVEAERHVVWESALEWALGKLARYQEQFGKPDEDLTFMMIEERLDAQHSNGLLGPSARRALFGEL